MILSAPGVAFNGFDVEPTAVYLFKQTAFRKRGISSVLHEGGTEGDGGLIIRQRFFIQNLQTEELGVVAKVFEFLAEGDDIFLLRKAVGVVGFEDVANLAQRVGTVPGAHEGYGRIRHAPLMIGLTTILIQFPARTWAILIHIY